MIDDITLRGYVPQGQPLEVPPENWSEAPVQRKHVKDDRNGQPVEAWLTHQGFVSLTIIPSLRRLVLRLSVPRMDGFYNFPLKPLPNGVGSMDLDTPTEFIRRATGWSPSPGLAGWGVGSLSYSLDVPVGVNNVTPTLDALAVARRTYTMSANGWQGRNGARTGIQFGSDERRVLFYDKQAEVLSRIRRLLGRHEPFGRGRVEERRALAERAAGHIRFEVTLRGSEEVRAPFDIPGGFLPTLRLMAQPSTARYMMTEELQRLRLHEVEGEVEAAPEVLGLDDLLSEVSRQAEVYNDSPAGRQRRIHRMRQFLMFGYSVALSQMTRDRIVEVLGGGASSFFQLERDMRSIGMPTLGATSAAPYRHLRAFMEALRGQMPEFPSSSPPDLGPEPYAAGYVTDSPLSELEMDHDHEGLGGDDLDDLEAHDPQIDT